LARAVYSTMVDFRSFNVSFPWAERFSVEMGSGGGFPFRGTSYDSAYVLDYDRPDFTDGRLRFFGDSFTQNGSNHLTGGLVQAMVGEFSEGITTVRQFFITGMSVSAATIHNTMRTASLTDDAALGRLIFNGNDNITLSSFSDYAYGANGNDTILGNGGSDKIYGQAGNDSISGGKGLDALYGNDGVDRLFGGNGGDLLSGGAGNDALTGGTGADIFEFRAGGQNDTVLDWTDGEDELRVYGPVGTVTVNLNEIAGGHVQVSVLGMQILVLNAEIGDFQIIDGSSFVSLI
jgi:Ca2+-binding RTX toxin-like protein